MQRFILNCLLLWLLLFYVIYRYLKPPVVASDHIWQTLLFLVFIFIVIYFDPTIKYGNNDIYISKFSWKMFLQVADGTFIEEPGSGTVAIIEDRKVSVGTIDWLRRCCPWDYFLIKYHGVLDLFIQQFISLHTG